LLGFAVEIRQHDRRVLAKLQMISGKAQGGVSRFRIRDNRKFSKVTFAF